MKLRKQRPLPASPRAVITLPQARGGFVLPPRRWGGTLFRRKNLRVVASQATAGADCATAARPEPYGLAMMARITAMVC